MSMRQSHDPQILFVCRRNAGRSQMAAGLLERESVGRVGVNSAGLAPADAISPVVVEAMAELGVDLSARRPSSLEEHAARSADLIVTMGCSDACPVYAGVRYVDWDVPDPSGKSLEEVRLIRDDIASRVRALWVDLEPELEVG
jgi:arsenate reductase